MKKPFCIGRLRFEFRFAILREFACMFEEADKNQDGRIDFEEFQAMMLPDS